MNPDAIVVVRIIRQNNCPPPPPTPDEHELSIGGGGILRQRRQKRVLDRYNSADTRTKEEAPGTLPILCTQKESATRISAVA